MFYNNMHILRIIIYHTHIMSNALHTLIGMYVKLKTNLVHLIYIIIIIIIIHNIIIIPV